MVKKLEANLCQSFQADLKAHSQQQQQNLARPAGCPPALCSPGQSVFNDWSSYLSLSCRARSRSRLPRKPLLSSQGSARVSAPTVVSPHRVWQLGQGR